MDRTAEELDDITTIAMDAVDDLVTRGATEVTVSIGDVTVHATFQSRQAPTVGLRIVDGQQEE
jgi:hypothetical protein